MITEDYISFEVAKLLKEKGFDVETRGYYPIKGDATGRLFANSSSEYNHNHSQVQISAPTLQMAMKWLREARGIFILIEYDPPVFSADIYSMNDVDEHGGARRVSPTFANHKSYEEACEAGVKYCLEKLI